MKWNDDVFLTSKQKIMKQIIYDEFEYEENSDIKIVLQSCLKDIEQEGEEKDKPLIESTPFEAEDIIQDSNTKLEWVFDKGEEK